MTAATALLARVRAEGFRVTLLPDRRVNVRPTPPADLLAELRAARDAISDLLAAEATTPRLTRPGALPGDPAAPLIDPEASRSLCILELAAAGPYLTADSRLKLTHPERVTAEERATAQRHAADIAALLSYRELIEHHRPVGHI